MTPERLDEIRGETARRLKTCDEYRVSAYPTLRNNVELLEYIDLLHEDLRITRQERDHAKHQALEHRKRAAALERERDEYRKGQGRAPAEHGPIPDGLFLDHTCHNASCVRPSHLRLASNSQNQQNLTGATRANKTSGYRNVYPDRKRWVAEVMHEGTKHRLGRFDTPEQANEVATAFRLAHFTHNDIDRINTQEGNAV